MAKLFPKGFKAHALRLLDKGVYTRAAQAQLKKKYGVHVGEGTLRKWAKARDAASAPPPPPAPPELDEDDDAPLSDLPEISLPPEAEPIDVSGLDTYEETKRAIAEANRDAAQARRDGNHSAVARARHAAAEYTKLLARLDKDRKGSADGVTFTRAELDHARQAMRDRVAALAADLRRTGGIVCSQCGRDIRIALAKGDLEDPNLNDSDNEGKDT